MTKSQAREDRCLVAVHAGCAREMVDCFADILALYKNCKKIMNKQFSNHPAFTATQPPKNMPSSEPSPRTTWLLQGAMHRDNPKEFRTILEREGWPRDSPWSDYELLSKAIDLKRRRIVDVLLRMGCRVARDNSAVKLLHRVVELNWIDVVENFLERGARVYDQDSAGNTALHVAFFCRASEKMMGILLTRYGEETSFNVQNCEGLSVWHVMCAGPRHEFVERALKCGFADVNSKVSLKSTIFAGYTALHFAVEYNRLEIARHLLDRNANIYAKDAIGSTPLHLACKHRNVEMIDLIFSYDKLNDNAENDYGLSHFMCASAGSNTSIVKYFLNTAESQSWTCPKILVNSQVKGIPNYRLAGYTALHFAAEFGRYETVELLLSYEPPCCVVNFAKETAVELASREEHQRVFLVLLKYCVDYRKSEQRKSTAGRFDHGQTNSTTKSEGYQVPDSWFIRQARPREYPRFVNVKGSWGVSIIPIHGPKLGMEYEVCVLNEPYLRSYFVL